MKFMLLMQGTCKGFEALSTWSPEDFAAHIQFMLRFNEGLKAAGELVSAEGLDLPNQAKIVSAKDASKPIVSDGPFPESKEFLAGFWIVDVDSEQRAIEIAAQASVAPGKGGEPIGIPIEVRKVGCAPDVG